MHNATYEASIDATVGIYPDFPYIQASPEEIASMKSREPVKCLCSTCGKPFYIQKNQLLARIKRRLHTAFCCKECGYEHQRQTHSKQCYVCETCGRQVNAKDYYGSGRFCSAWCARSFSGRFAASLKEAQKKKSESLKKWHQKHPRPKKSKPQSNQNKTRQIKYVTDEAKILELHKKYNLYDISLILHIPADVFYNWASKHGISDERYLSHLKFKIISACRNALNKPFEDGSITVEEYNQVRKECIRLMYEDNLNPRQVCSEYLKLDKSYHQFLSLSMGIQLKNLSDSQKAYYHRIGTYDNMDEKAKYYLECKFTFSDDLLPYLPGFESLVKLGWYNSRSNLQGVAKDHMVSRNYGWTHSIDPYLISHPANCTILPQVENEQKSSKCSITVNELIERVEWFNETLLSKSDKNEILFRKNFKKYSTLALL